ncbi:MAG TPA: ClbS/DfsB family four-helix bundle protein [Bacteroidota bacterium]
MTKQELLQNINAEWKKFFESISELDDERKVFPRFIGEWSLKDLMGHMSSWESVALERLGRMKRNEPVEFIPDEQIDEWNKKFYELRRDWKLIVVEGELESVHTRLVQEIERMDDRAWDENQSNVCEWLPECTFVHYAEHYARLEEKLSALTVHQGARS